MANGGQNLKLVGGLLVLLIIILFLVSMFSNPPGPIKDWIKLTTIALIIGGIMIFIIGSFMK